MPLPINRACDNYNCRPPTSCRVFLLRTLPPPGTPEQQNTQTIKIDKPQTPPPPIITFIFLGPFTFFFML